MEEFRKQLKEMQQVTLGVVFFFVKLRETNGNGCEKMRKLLSCDWLYIEAMVKYRRVGCILFTLLSFSWLYKGCATALAPAVS